MPLKKLLFRPGVSRENTRYISENVGPTGVGGSYSAGWYDCDKVRFRSGTPEKIGGWSRLSNDTYLGVPCCRPFPNQWCDRHRGTMNFLCLERQMELRLAQLLHGSDAHMGHLADHLPIVGSAQWWRRPRAINLSVLQRRFQEQTLRLANSLPWRVWKRQRQHYHTMQLQVADEHQALTMMQFQFFRQRVSAAFQ